MNILKAFKEEEYMDMYFDNFVQYSGKHKSVSLSDAKVTTKEGDKIWFRTIDSLDKACLLSGICFQKVDFMGYFWHAYDLDEEIMNYLNSRIRGKNEQF